MGKTLVNLQSIARQLGKTMKRDEEVLRPPKPVPCGHRKMLAEVKRLLGVMNSPLAESLGKWLDEQARLMGNPGKLGLWRQAEEVKARRRYAKAFERELLRDALSDLAEKREKLERETGERMREIDEAQALRLDMAESYAVVRHHAIIAQTIREQREDWNEAELELLKVLEMGEERLDGWQLESGELTRQARESERRKIERAMAAVKRRTGGLRTA